MSTILPPLPPMPRNKRSSRHNVDRDAGAVGESALIPLPPLLIGPRSTACEVRRWKTVAVAEALATKEPFLPIAFQSDDKAPSRQDDPQTPLCDVRRWETITVEEALRTEEDGRCVECKKPVRAHKASISGMAAHFEHLRQNPSCPRSDPR